MNFASTTMLAMWYRGRLLPKPIDLIRDCCFHDSFSFLDSLIALVLRPRHDAHGSVFIVWRSFRCCMIYTEAFCTACLCNVALGDTSPQAKRFVDASCNMNGMLIGDDGHCFHCGKSGLVVLCMIPEPTNIA